LCGPIRVRIPQALDIDALFALYKEHLVGAWRWIYVITAVVSLYLNVFVLVVQSFVKVSALNALAPMQTEPPFAVNAGRCAGHLHSDYCDRRH
jgi:hypothetical protein